MASHIACNNAITCLGPEVIVAVLGAFFGAVFPTPHPPNHPDESPFHTCH